MKDPGVIEPSKMKAQQFRNLAMFAGFSAIAAIRPVDAHALRVRRVWALIVYSMRLLRLPWQEFQAFSDTHITRISKTLLDAWIKAFGLRSCVYNVHVAICHILEVKV